VPELPDVLLYLKALAPRIVGRRVAGIRLASPFLLRSINPPLSAVEGRAIVGLRRLGKRIVIEVEGELFLVVHLMIAGRFRWKEPGARIPGKVGLIALDFAHGTLILTRPARSGRRRFMSSPAAPRWRNTIAVVSRSWTLTSRRSPARCGVRTTRSSVR